MQDTLQYLPFLYCPPSHPWFPYTHRSLVSFPLLPSSCRPPLSHLESTVSSLATLCSFSSPLLTHAPYSIPAPSWCGCVSAENWAHSSFQWWWILKHTASRAQKGVAHGWHPRQDGSAFRHLAMTPLPQLGCTQHLQDSEFLIVHQLN